MFLKSRFLDLAIESSYAKILVHAKSVPYTINEETCKYTLATIFKIFIANY